MSTVKDYYNRSQKWYTHFYYDRTSLGMHYGLWDTHTGSRQEALINPYREIATLLNPAEGDLFLDAGCGVGGAIIWLAENTPGKYIGITISPVQLKLARKYAQSRKVAQRVEFRQENYFNTSFPDNTFDGVFGVESFCHSYPNPERVFAEMFRILNPGGKIVIFDGVLMRRPHGKLEKKLAADFCHNVKMEGWCSKEEIITALIDSGFVNVQFADKTENIKKSIQDIYLRGLLLSPLLLLYYIGLISRTEKEFSSFYRTQKLLYETGTSGYGMFYAQKAHK